MPLIDFDHTHFGENKVQEAVAKWRNKKSKKINLHMVENYRQIKQKTRLIFLNIFTP